MIVIVAFICIAFFGIQFFSLVVFLFPVKEKKSFFSKANLPKVSILLAARNEEKLILRSLEHIAKLDYPKDKLQVLVGNDASTDRTEEIVRNFISDKDIFTLINVEKNMGKGRGKANVLAHLAHSATGEFFFITDVDVALPQEWIKSLVGLFTPKVGIVSGTTTCEDNGKLFSTMQSIDWLHFMGYMQSFSFVGVGCTSVGNNMAVRKEAYWETGGFENIDFSITEDYKLFQSVTDNNWEWRTQWKKSSLGLAWYLSSFSEMLHQRKRWLIGARDLPWNWKVLIVLYGLFIPTLLILFIMNPALAAKIWFTKFLVQTIYIHILATRVGLKPFSFAKLCIYELYVMANTFITSIFYLLPISSVWKGRKYSSKNLS